MMATGRSVHLYRDDTPGALAILSALLGNRQALGYTPDEYGAEVDWDLLVSGNLSTTEIATIHIARGVATFERQGGGLPWTVHDALLTALGHMRPR